MIVKIECMETTVLKPYLRITTPDENYFVWVKRPDSDRRSYLTFNFGMNTKFADALDALAYLTVESISRLDAAMCSIVFRLEGNATECMKRLVDDIPDIMDKLEL